MVDEAENLQRDHRQYTRHHVQNQPAEKRVQQHLPKRLAGRGHGLFHRRSGAAGCNGIDRKPNLECLRFGVILQVADSQASKLAWPSALIFGHRFPDADTAPIDRGHFAFRRHFERLGWHRKKIGIVVRLAGIELDQQRSLILLGLAVPHRLDGQRGISFRQSLPRGIELGRVGRERVRAGDCQRGAHQLIARDAELLALKPTDLAGDRRLARRGIGGNGERHEQDGLAVVTVTDRVKRGELLRRWPLDRSGGHALGQRPLDFSLEAGRAGVDPVGVPAVVHRQLQSGRHRRSRLGFGMGQQQLGRGRRLGRPPRLAAAERIVKLRAEVTGNRQQKKECETTGSHRGLGCLRAAACSIPERAIRQNHTISVEHFGRESRNSLP